MGPVLQVDVERTLWQGGALSYTFSSEYAAVQESYPQSNISDILSFGNLEIASLPSTAEIIAVMDQTTLEAGFDSSCLEGVDHRLLSSPFEAFAATCWADAVYEPVDLCCDHSLAQPLLSFGPGSSRDSLSDESCSDTDECRTFDLAILPASPFDLTAKPYISRSPPIDTHSLFHSFRSSHKFEIEPKVVHVMPHDPFALHFTSR